MLYLVRCVWEQWEKRCPDYGAVDCRRSEKNNRLAGCCGALAFGYRRLIFIPTAALRQEGTSYHYLPPSREIELDSDPIDVLCRMLERAELKKVRLGNTDEFEENLCFD